MFFHVFAAQCSFYCFAFMPEVSSLLCFFSCWSCSIYLFLGLCLPISVLQVMAILPSHFLWQRERLEHHSGAQRQYGDQDRAGFPRGPLASPVSCALCNRGSRFDEAQGSSSPSRGSSAKTPSPAFSHPLTSMLNLETTPQRATFHRNAVKKTKIQTRHSSCYCAEEVPSRYR